MYVWNLPLLLPPARLHTIRHKTLHPRNSTHMRLPRAPRHRILLNVFLVLLDICILSTTTNSRNGCLRYRHSSNAPSLHLQRRKLEKYCGWFRRITPGQPICTRPARILRPIWRDLLLCDPCSVSILHETSAISFAGKIRSFCFRTDISVAQRALQLLLTSLCFARTTISSNLCIVQSTWCSELSRKRILGCPSATVLVSSRTWRHIDVVSPIGLPEVLRLDLHDICSLCCRLSVYGEVYSRSQGRWKRQCLPW